MTQTTFASIVQTRATKTYPMLHLMTAMRRKKITQRMEWIIIHEWASANRETIIRHINAGAVLPEPERRKPEFVMYDDQLCLE